MKQRMVFGVLLGSALLGLVAIGTAQTEAQSDARPVKEEARAAQADKVESNREVPAAEPVMSTEGVFMTEEEIPEVYQAVRDHLAGIERPTRQQPSIQTVKTSGGTLVIVDQGQGIIQVVGIAIDRENPKLGETQGIAFSAAIGKNGVEVTDVDTTLLARFVGETQSVTPHDDQGGVAVAGETSVYVDCTSSGGTKTCLIITETRICTCVIPPNGQPSCQCFVFAA